jgi:hypothetical protein
MRFGDTWRLSARLSAKCQSQTTYLTLVEMSQAVDQSPGRSKRDDRLCEGLARVATAVQMLRQLPQATLDHMARQGQAAAKCRNGEGTLFETIVSLVDSIPQDAVTTAAMAILTKMPVESSRSF